MSTDNTKSSREEEQNENTQNALIFISSYSTIKLPEIQKLCDANNFDIGPVIYNYTLHDVRPYKEMIKYIAAQKTAPIVLIDRDMSVFPQSIMGTTVLGTLEEMKLVKIRTYSREINKGYKLTMNTKYSSDLLTDATWQIRSIERIYQEESAARIRNKDKKDCE
jgi:hypothetical protein